MTPVEWQKLEQAILSLSAEEQSRLRALLNRPLNPERKASDPLLGLMADEPDLVDRVLESAMTARERDPLRIPADAEDAA